MDPKFDKRDLAQCENLIKALKKAKFELDGMEVLAFADMMKWVNSLYSRIQAEMNPPPAIPKEIKSPVEEAPKAETPKKPKKGQQ